MSAVWNEANEVEWTAQFENPLPRDMTVNGLPIERWQDTTKED